ncbi:sensor histidine kinase [Roseateles amylovorans]|uniref:histidine kinase n=1 Tax=Roseateles amylovorans TaxID=2978473 RepID=A0ABY6B3N3_9BURK|nr:ATP-binding protein [Roseateles amylovorans]UXH78831.1 ATP-binding protein [Roseateles amylovorans]
MLEPAVRSLHRLRTATLVGAIVLSLATLAALVGPAWVGREEALTDARARGELLAQLMEADANRTIETAALALHALGDTLRMPDSETHDADHLSEHLTHVLVGLPFMRSVSLLDADGRVLSSTNPDDLGLQIDLAQLGRLPAPDRDALLPLRPGRSLVDLTGHPPPFKAGVSMLPLMLQLPVPSPDTSGEAGPDATLAKARWLLALIHPDALAQVRQQALPSTRSTVWLASTDGQLLAAMETLPQQPGERLVGHPAFEQLQRGREHGSYLGAGVLPGDLVVAWRASPRRSLMVGVEQPKAEVLAGWRSDLGWLVLIGLFAFSLIVLATVVVRRSLQARADAMQALQQAHEQLADRERDMRVLLRSVQELIFRTDPLGVLTFVNARWTTMHHGRPDEAVGRRLTDLAEPADRAGLTALFCDEAGPRSVEASIRNGEGELRRYVIAVVPLMRETQLLGYAGSAVDVTERVAAERLTREARDAAEAASQVKTEFLANISHELRTPLQSILGFSELGMQRSGDQAKLRAMFEDIHGSGQRMLTMVNDLLDVAKIESPLGAFELERHDLCDLVREVAHELAPLTAKRSLALQLDLAQPLPARVDPGRFQQAVRNILANAIRFAPSGSALDVHGEITADGELHLCVADRGPGIPEAELERIFDPFVQSSVTKDGSGGTGLGLPISRKIIEVHGGRLQARNRIGGGAEFHLHLPQRGATDTVLAELAAHPDGATAAH